MLETARRKNRQIAILTLFAVAMAVQACIAQEDQEPLPYDSQWLSSRISRHFGVREGLPSNWINDILQTQDDYVWIGTDNGLVRFDGANFKVFTPVNVQQSPAGEIRVLAETRDGSLWIGATLGLTTYRPGRPGRFESVPELSGKTVRAIYEDRDGAIWIGTDDETYLRRRDEMPFEPLPDVPRSVRAICEDGNGTHWIGSQRGLFRRQGDSFLRMTHERLPAQTPQNSGVPQTRVNRIFLDDSGDLWVAANRVLLHLHEGEFTTRGQEIEDQQMYDLARTRDGSLYVGARFGLFRSTERDPFVEVSRQPSANCVMEDRVGSLWVGHADNRGLYRYRENQAVSVWSDSRVRCVMDAGDDLWFGSSVGLHRLRDGSVTSYGVEQGLPDLRVQSVAESGDGMIWIGTARGFAKWTGTEIVPVNNESDLLDEMNIGVCFEDSSGRLWFSLATAGAFTLGNDELREIDQLARGRTRWFWEDPDHVIWIGHESGLFQSKDGVVQPVTNEAFEQLHQPRFLCHTASPDGTLWMGTSNGIARYRDGRFDAFPPACGLRADNIERIVVDGQRLWLGGRDGLFHVRIAELDAIASSSDLPTSRAPTTVTSYRVEGFDRFPPINAFSQGFVARDDYLWVVSEHGLVRIPTNALEEKTPPPAIRLEHAIIDGVEADFERPFDYLAGSRRLSIEFAVIDHVHPEHVHVRYRLDGYDDDWIETENERVAQYTDLRPGDYRFRVMVRHGNEDWIEAAETMEFAVLPRWWESAWTRVFALLLSAGGVFGYIHHRIRVLRHTNQRLSREINEREKAEQESRLRFEQLARVSRASTMGELTTSIAHEVKQPLFAIVSNAQTGRKLLEREKPDLAEVREALVDIAHDGKRASSIIDRIRMLVRKEHQPAEVLDLNQLARDATEFVSAEIRKRGLEIQLDLANDLPLVSGDAVELQQVIFNLLLNGAQAMWQSNSDGGQLSLRTSSVDGFVQVAVQDQGAGVDDDVFQNMFEPFYTTKPTGTGMGLAINRTIVEAHGGRIWAERNEGQGMTMLFRLPVFPSD